MRTSAGVIPLAFSLLLLVLALPASGCSPKSPEAEWDSFIEAVKDHRGDDAAKHVDMERVLGADEESKAAWGGGADAYIDGFRELMVDNYYSRGLVPVTTYDTPATDLVTIDGVETTGDTALLTFHLDAETVVVTMERDGRGWKIVDF